MATSRKKATPSETVVESVKVDSSDVEKKLEALEARFEDLLGRLQDTPGIKSRVSGV